MVDSCFKVFHAKCFRKSSIKTHRDSCDSIFQNDKSAMTNAEQDKKLNFTHSHRATPIDSDRKAASDRIIYEGELEPDVVLRRHDPPYRYLQRSISAATSHDATSSDDDENENLDVLYPLPYVNTHERILEEANRQVDKNNGMEKFLWCSIICLRERN